jgi:hypothetical protein
VDRDRSDIQVGQPLPERDGLGRRLGPPLPGRGVVAEYLNRRCADVVRALNYPNQAEAHRQVDACAPPAGQPYPLRRHGRVLGHHDRCQLSLWLL